MRTVILLAVLLMYGSAPAPVFATNGVQRVASAVKGKVWHLGATGVMAGLLLFNAPTGVEAGQVAEVTQQAETETKSQIDWDKFERELPDIIARAAAKTDVILDNWGEIFIAETKKITREFIPGEIVLTHQLFPEAGLLDSLPASVRRLEVSKIKHGLQQLVAQIDAMALPMGQADDLFSYFYNSGKDVEKVRVMNHVYLLAQSKSYRRIVERLEKEAQRKAYLYMSGQHNEWVMWYSRAIGNSAKGLSTNPSNIDAALQYLRVQYDEVATLAQEVDSGETDKKWILVGELGILRERAKQTLSVIEKTERDKAKKRRHMWRFGR